METETRICSVCKEEKSVLSFYKTKHSYKDGRRKYQHSCIKCKGKADFLSKQDAQKQYDFILNKTAKSVYKYYLVTLLDDKFNEADPVKGARPAVLRNDVRLGNAGSPSNFSRTKVVLSA